LSAVESDGDATKLHGTSGEQPPPSSLAELLQLARTTPNRFVGSAISTGGRRRLYGGQVAAQALRAASLTVPDDRIAHSIHGYFLRGGDAGQPIVFDVERDRDGGRYSARRVAASQGGAVIFSMSCSFSGVQSNPGSQAGFQAVTAPPAESPDDLDAYQLDMGRTFDLEARLPADLRRWYRWPPRLWVRVREPLGDDPNVQACGVVFASDLSTGLSLAPQIELVGLVPSLDHTVWLHQSCRANNWLLVDMHPLVAGGGRGVYTGHLYDREGALVASLAQETLFDVQRGESQR
jgi:acyl-CoA thioesterase II